MEIKYTTQNFTGYDARHLKGLFVSDKRCADALKRLAKSMEVDIYTPSIASKSIRKEQNELASQNKLIWAQDYITVMDTRAILFDNTRDFLKRTKKKLKRNNNELKSKHNEKWKLNKLKQKQKN